MAARKGRIAPIVLVLLVALLVIVRKPLLRATMPVVEDAQLSELVIENDSAFVKISLVVRNKGVWHIELQRVQLSLYDGDVELMSYESDSLKIFDRNEVKREELYCRIPLKTVMERIRDHQGEDTIGLHLRGTLVYSTFLGTMSSEIDREVPVNVPIPPTLFVRGIEFRGMEDGNFNLLFHLTLKNQNPRALEMKNVAYEMQGSNGISLAGEIGSFSIAAEDSTQLDIPGRMKIDNRLSLLTEILLDNDQMEYNFVLRGTIESLTGIAHDDVPVTINKAGTMEVYNEDKRKSDRPRFSFRRK